MRSITETSLGMRRAAFTIPELIAGIVLTTFFALMTIRIVIAAKQLLPGRATTVAGVVIPIAPSVPSFADAVRLHSVFIKRLHGTRAAYVFGGEHEGIPATASRCSLAPLNMQSVPLITDVSRGLPMDAYAFREIYSLQLGAQETKANAQDFTVLLVGALNGALQATTLIQVRSVNISLKDGASSEDLIRREVDLYDVTEGQLSYIFLEKAGLAAEAAVGARHFWYRYAEGKIAEEGPAVVVFPDPWLWSQPDANSDLPSLSRFVYCLPISV